MGRAERRKLERRSRLDDRKNKVLMTREEVSKMKKQVTQTASNFSVEALMTCFALAEHNLYGYGQTRILRTLKYIDDLMGPIIDGTATIDDYKKELEEKCNVKIACGDN